MSRGRSSGAGARVSQELYQALFTQDADGVLIADSEGRVADANRRVGEMLGYAVEELLGRSLDMLIPSDPDTHLPERSHSPQVLLRECRLKRRDGTPLPAQVSVWALPSGGVLAMVRDEAHRPHVWFLSSLDKINRAMQRTTDLEQMVGDVLDAVLSIFECDRAWLCYPFERRPSWLSLIERARPEYPGGLALGVGEWMDVSAVAAFERVRAAGGPVISGPEGDLALPAELTRKYGMRSQIAMAVYPRIGDAWIFGLHQCSYPRVWTPAEKQLFQEIGPRLADVLTGVLAYRHLRQSEHKLEEAERVAHVGWWEQDFTTGQSMLSREARHILGLSPDEELVTGSQWQARWEGIVHPEDRDGVVRALEEALRGGPRYAMEYRVIWPDGQVRFVHAEADVWWSESGRLRRVFGVIQDITERKELEGVNERLRAQFHQAQKMESLGRLAGGIAHDFNNLLVPIIGYLDLNLEELPRDSDLHRDLVQVRRAAERAATLTQQILAFSRKQVLKLQPISLNEAVEGFKGMLERLIGEDVELRTFLDSALEVVRADKGQIEQVLLNLAINSRDAMPEGGRLTIETENTYLDEAYLEKHGEGMAAGSYVMLAVSDNGQGMDAQTRERVFDPFFTTKESGKGTGLGLATVFGIVKQHRGHIGVYSEPGQGTTFKIYLPAARGASRAAIPEAREPVSVHGTEIVLVVEDEEMVRQLVCETLAAHGYRVMDAGDPADALRLAGEQETIHLLLTDVIMPAMNGKELHEKLLGLHPSCRVLYMSGYTHNVIVHHGVLKEGIEFLQKPFTIRDLTRRVREVLDA